jgi:hypothetical protein
VDLDKPLSRRREEWATSFAIVRDAIVNWGNQYFRPIDSSPALWLNQKIGRNLPGSRW